MSSMRNAVQRRNHKERAQPKERERWGILEKHKDYSLRAADYNAKKARLKILRQKAAERNPDEFYFGMYSSSTHDKGQKVASRGNESLSHEAVKLLKTQDAGYLRTLAQSTRRAREKLEGGFVVKDGEGILVGGLGGQARGEKVVFARDREEQRGFGAERGARKKNPSGKASQTDSGSLVDDDALDDAEADEKEEKEEEATELVKPVQKSRRALEADAAALKQARALRKQRRREQEARLSRLKALSSREKDILAAEQELVLQRAKMGNSVGGVNKAGVKFKVRERKR